MLPPDDERDLLPLLAPQLMAAEQYAPIAGLPPQPGDSLAPPIDSVPGAAAAPVAEPAATARELPPPIDLPERRDFRTGNRGGRIAHGIAGSLLNVLSGGRTDAGYRDRMDREQALGERDYRDQLKEYNLAVQAQGRGQDMLPVPDEIAALSGLPAGTTYRDANVAQGLGVGSRLRSQEHDDRTRELLSERQRGQSELLADRQKGAKELELLRQSGRAKKRGGGGGRGGANAFGVTRDQHIAILEQASKDSAAGLTGTDAQRKAALLATSTGAARQNSQIRQMGTAPAARVKAAENEIGDFYRANSDTVRSIASWEEFAAQNADQLDGWVGELQQRGYTASSPGAKSMVRSMRPPIAAFLRKMAGAAMSPAEAGLHAGPLAPLLVDSRESWASADGVAQRLEAWVAKQGADVNDLFAMMDRVSNDVDEKFQASLRGVPTVALRAVSARDRPKVLRAKLQEMIGSANLPEGAQVDPKSVRLDGYRILFQWRTPDMPPGEFNDGAAE